MIFLYLFLSIFAGALFAVQGPINSALGHRTSTFFGTMVSFGGGFLVMLLLLLCTGTSGLSQLRQAAPWQLIGGMYGVICVLIAVYTIPRIGSALMLTITLFTQLVTGALLDTFGWLGTAQSPVSLLRMLGLAVIAAGILVFYFGSADPASGKRKFSPVVLLPVVGGISGSLQAATNASLSALIGRTGASLVSFAFGFFLIFLITLLVSRGRFVPLRGQGIRPWMVIGGLFGAIAIYLNITTAPHIGVALLMASQMVGQLGGGLVVDTFGLLQVKKRPLSRGRALGIAIIGCGVLLACFGA